jgi:hypothetical protein
MTSKQQLTPEQSEVVCRAYKLHGGRWPDVMADAEVCALGVDPRRIERHVNYKKKLLRAKRSSHAQSISSEDEAEDSRDSNYGEEEESPVKRDADAALAPTRPLKKLKLTGQVGDSAVHIAEAMRASAVRSSDDVAQTQKRVRSQEKAVRAQPNSPSSREKSRQDKNREALELQASVQTTALEVMRKLMSDLERDEQSTYDMAALEDALAKNHAIIIAVKRDVDALRAKVDSLGEIVAVKREMETLRVQVESLGEMMTTAGANGAVKHE